MDDIHNKAQSSFETPALHHDAEFYFVFILNIRIESYIRWI